MAGIGTVGLALLNRWLTRADRLREARERNADRDADRGDVFHAEQSKALERCTQQLTNAQRECDDWRTRYYDLRDVHSRCPQVTLSKEPPPVVA